MYVEVHGGPFDGICHRFDDKDEDASSVWTNTPISQSEAKLAGIPLAAFDQRDAQNAAYFWYHAMQRNWDEFCLPSPAALIEMEQNPIQLPKVLHRYILTRHSVVDCEVHAEFSYVGDVLASDQR